MRNRDKMNYTIILRHAERNKIKRIEETETAKITLNGLISSIRMGFFLNQKFKDITKIKTSYIERCYNTARYIKWAYAPFKKIEISRAKNNGELVSSGYMKNEHFWDWVHFHYGREMKWVFFEEYYYEMIKRGWANYNSIDEFTYDFLKENLTNQNTLIITHDTTVIPLLIGLKKYGTKELFPHPLSGIIIYHKNGEIKKLEWIEKNKIKNI